MRKLRGKKHGSKITYVCNYTVDMVIERASAHAGKIVYARPKVVEKSPSEEPEPGCPEFAECIDQTRTGQEMPIPPGVEATVSIAQNLQATPMPDYMKDPKHLAMLISTFKKTNLESKRLVADGDPTASHQYRSFENRIRYLEKKRAEIEADR
ncbi:MAG TPA: hypothetical protein VGG33_20370 [Polyangia bacterium]